MILQPSLEKKNIITKITYDATPAKKVGMDGKSAYQIAVENGLFTGTEQEYANYPITQGDYAKIATQAAEDATQKALNTASGIDSAILKANTATVDAMSATQRALVVIDSTIIEAQSAQVAANNANTKAALAASKALIAENVAGTAIESATYATQKGDYAKQSGDYARETSDKIKKSILDVTVTQTTVTDIAYTFTKANFDPVAEAAQSGLPVFVKLIDNRVATYKTRSIDLSGIHPAKWNTTLSQIEISDPNIARGFYINGTTPASRGCVTVDTLKYINLNTYARHNSTPFHYISFNAVSGYYKMCGITDIDEQEMALIYHYSQVVSSGRNLFRDISRNSIAGFKLRTLFPSCNVANLLDADSMYYGNTGLEVLWLRYQPIDATSMFHLCSSLREVCGFNGYDKDSLFLISLSDSSKAVNMFNGCTSLETALLARLKVSLSLQWSPLLSYENGVKHIIDNSAATSKITLTLHPTAIANARSKYLLAPVSNFATLDEYALSKNIALATV